MDILDPIPLHNYGATANSSPSAAAFIRSSSVSRINSGIFSVGVIAAAKCQTSAPRSGHFTDKETIHLRFGWIFKCLKGPYVMISRAAS